MAELVYAPVLGTGSVRIEGSSPSSSTIRKGSFSYRLLIKIMDTKIVLSIFATVIAAAAFLPYLRDIFSLKTKPHAYTWLIWAITQGTAVFGIWYGGGGWGVLNLIVGTLLVVVVFLFSLKYGTKNITKSDTAIFIAALSAIVVWWQLDKPLISVMMVSVIDVIGYIPSFRKSYLEPWSETLVTWILFSVSNILAILALKEYNLLTVTYLVAITTANIAFILVCFFRRQFITKP